jgi:ureidoacrylate peracid hydrolase
MSETPIPITDTALLIVDLQNDFVHPDGAYGRAGLGVAEIAVLPARLAPLAQDIRALGGCVVSTQFTLVPGRGGEPIISSHLKAMRPFLRRGDFLPGAWGHHLVDALQPADLMVEKVANGGVASTVREAHVRDIETVVLADGCAAFTPQVHQTAIDALRPVCRIADVAEMRAEIAAAGGHP